MQYLHKHLTCNHTLTFLWSYRSLLKSVESSAGFICWDTASHAGSKRLKEKPSVKSHQRQELSAPVPRVNTQSSEVLCWVDMLGHLHHNSSLLYHTTNCCHSDKLAKGTVSQEVKFAASVWHNFLSGVCSTSPPCSVGFKASEAFRSVSFPPWNPWISHITSHCPCQAVAHSATAHLCP